MSEEPNQKQQNQNKKEKKQKGVPTGSENDKANTDAWKQKMAKKKLQKQSKQAQGEVENKQDKKQKKKKQKQNKEKPKQQQKAQENKDKDKKSKPQNESQKVQQPIQPQFKKLETIQTLIIPKHPQLLYNRSAQIQLIQKQLLNLIRPKDTILHLGKLKLQSNPKLLPGSGRNNFKIVDIPGYASHQNSEIVCRYQDISYLISEEINKIFIQAEVIFRNGSALVRKGYQNIILIANYYKKPVILVSGSWNYSQVVISNYDQLQSIYGQESLNKYDWIDTNSISLVCMESGSVLPSQISYQVEQGYKNYGISNQKW